VFLEKPRTRNKLNNMTANKPVVVYLRGGLGNQLFQYAAGLSLSKKVGSLLYLNTSLLPDNEESRAGVNAWPDQISSFENSADLITNKHPLLLTKHTYQRAKQLERLIGDKFPRFMLKLGTYANERNEAFQIFNSTTTSKDINSYCNSITHFVDNSELIRSQVLSIRNPSDWFIKNLDGMYSQEPIAIHARLGDYENLENVFGKFDPTYFKRAIDTIRETKPSSPIWLFSDNPKLAYDRLAKDIKFDEVVTPDPNSSAIESLVLLSKADSLIASNSSFSWWAAFLNVSNGKKIFPRPLYAHGGPPEPKDWLLPNWLQIGRVL
jgi:hypothetical protein